MKYAKGGTKMASTGVKSGKTAPNTASGKKTSYPMQCGAVKK